MTSPSPPVPAYVPLASARTTRVSHCILRLPPEIAATVPCPMPLSPVEYSFRDAWKTRNLFAFSAPTAPVASPSASLSCSFADDSFMPFSLLRSSFERLLLVFPTMAMRVEIDAKDGAPYVPALDGGVGWTESSADCILADLLAAEWTGAAGLPPALSLLPPFDPASPLTPPLCHVQLTRFACGGVVVGLHWQHHVADGESAGEIMRRWGQLFREARDKPDAHAFRSAELMGTEIPASVLPSTSSPPPPHLDRSWLHVDPAELLTPAEQQSLHHGKFELLPSTPPPAFVPSSADPPVRILRFSAAELAAMKAAAESQLHHLAPEERVPWLSTYQVLSAHLLRCMHAARTTDASPAPDDDEAPLELSTAVNVRGRMRMAGAPKGFFFGNAVLPTRAFIPVAHVQQNEPDSGDGHDDDVSLARVAASVHRSLEDFTQKDVQRMLAWLGGASRKDRIVRDDDWSRGLFLTSWVKFHPHSVCFEEGVTCAAVWPLKAVSGLGVMLDSARLDGSIEVHLGLAPLEAMERLTEPRGPLHKYRR